MQLAGVAASSKLPFVSSAAFMGSRPGFVFKNGDSGVGYYADGPLQAGAVTQAAPHSSGAAPASNPRPSAVQQVLDRQHAAAHGGEHGGDNHRISRLERVQAEQAARHRQRAAPRGTKDEVRWESFLYDQQFKPASISSQQIYLTSNGE